MKPLIGIIAGEIINLDIPWYPVAYGQPHTYTDAIIRAGGLPVIVPLTDDTKVIKALYDRLNGLMFAGGTDINPMRYGEKSRRGNMKISDKRDEVEWQLMKLAIKDNKPVLGICRGMQVINVVLSGSLYQDIARDAPHGQGHRGADEVRSLGHVAHVLKIAPSTGLGKILHTRAIKANANHHQAVKTLGNGLVATAWSEDGMIEGLELPEKAFVCGVQCHPEALEADIEPGWRKLFEAFVQASLTHKT
jgi:putative glutamine amidotransferase